MSRPLLAAFCSFTRGAGKTTIAASLARRLAERRRVALVDADLLAPGVGEAMHLASEPARSVNRLLLGEPVAGWPELAAGRLTVLPASDGFDDLRTARRGWDGERLVAELDEISRQRGLDAVLIDLPAGVTPETLTVVAAADLLVVVLRLDQQNYQGTAVLLDVARRLEVPRTWLIAGMVPATLDPATAAAELRRAYDTPALAVPFVSENEFASGPGWLHADALAPLAEELEASILGQPAT